MWLLLRLLRLLRLLVLRLRLRLRLWLWLWLWLLCGRGCEDGMVLRSGGRFNVRRLMCPSFLLCPLLLLLLLLLVVVVLLLLLLLLLPPQLLHLLSHLRFEEILRREIMRRRSSHMIGRWRREFGGGAGRVTLLLRRADAHAGGGRSARGRRGRCGWRFTHDG